jgi:hypothetical protein
VVVIATSVLGLAVGWVVGMWTRRRSDRWCPVDGTILACTSCRSVPENVDSPATHGYVALHPLVPVFPALVVPSAVPLAPRQIGFALLL